MTPETPSIPTGSEIRARRLAKDIALKDLAVAAGLSISSVGAVEKGRRTNNLVRLRISETLKALERERGEK